MTWEVAYGGREELMQKMARREGKLPAALAGKPELLSRAIPYFAAFKRLHSSRMILPDGSSGGIPLSEIVGYATFFGFDSLADRFDLMRYVQACDDAYTEETRRRRPKPGNAGTGKHPPRRR